MINTTSIKDKELFQKTMQKGKWFGGSFVCIYVLKNVNNGNQIGLAIGKKVGKAYRRNRIKRLIRQAYTDMENNINYGYSIVFVWKSSAKFYEADFNSIYKDIFKLFTKSGILK